MMSRYRNRPLVQVFAVCLATALVAAGCGSDDDAASDTTASSAAAVDTTIGDTADTTTGSTTNSTTTDSATASTTTASTTASTEPAPDIDDSAVLRIGEFLTNPGFKPEFDPIKPVSRIGIHYLFYVYDSLLRQNRDGSYSPALAESAEIVDESTIEVTLRSGLTFQDDTPLDAEAVKFSILRNKEAKNPGAMRQAELQTVESIDVTTETQLTIHLSSPVAGSFYNLLAHNETMPVSPTAVNAGTDLSADPVGAGPFRLVSSNDEVMKLERWPGFYAADDVHFAAIEIVNIASNEAMVNAYRTGAIDFTSMVSLTELDQLQGASIVSEVSTNDARVAYIGLACVKNPQLLADVRVRQALIYATDRDAVNERVYHGQGEVMSQFVGSADSRYDPALADLYTHDPEKARSLLAEAGQSDIHLTMAVGAIGVSTQIAEVLQQQWAEAGIDLEIVQSSNFVEDFFINGTVALGPNPGSGVFWWTDIFTTFFDPAGGFVATCPSSDPAFSDELLTLRGLETGSPESIDLFRQVSEKVLDQALVVPLAIAPTVAVWNARITAPKLRTSSNGSLAFDAVGSYVAAG
jgi:peptide/nickel transport system substrate-binding protein